ncbi:DUF4123 domain-containing protein [Providencia stuartii]|uniref:DUF4123 domain-containing protein n=1 Tax=Providencia stuartii TaxID=588 RepID=UPI003329C56A
MDIIKQFHEAYPIHLHSHAIIDRIIYPDLPEIWNANPIITDITMPQAHMYPYLIELGNINSEQRILLNNIIFESERGSGIILFNSKFDQDTLIYILANYLIYTSPAGDNYLLRYYDYNVFMQLVRIISPLNLRNKLNALGAEYVTFYSQYGHKTYIPNLYNEKQEPIYATTFSRIADIGIINSAIKKINKKMDINDFFYVSNILEEKISIARNKYFLTDKNDIITFISKCILIHKLYYISPEVNEVLSKTYKYPGCYHDEISLFSAERWRDILNFCRTNLDNK